MLKTTYLYLNKLLLLSTFYFLGSNPLHSQSSNEELAKSFDKTIGYGNLNINNGIVHTNEFRISKNKHRYYLSEKFEKGDVTYNDQTYFDVNLKYDLYQDNLVYQPEGSFVGFNLIGEKVGSFKIFDKKFVYLNSTLFPFSLIKSGFYQEIVTNKNTTFYIKHKKDKREVIKETSTFNEFDDNYEFFLKKNSTFYKIKTKKDLAVLFPESKRKIYDFYSGYSQLEKDDKPLFFEKIMAYINNTIENNTK